MPLLLIPLIVLLILLFVLLSIPIMLVQRYRIGTARRRARMWMVKFNLYAVAFSVSIFFLSAALSNIWIENALAYTSIGLVAGCLAGLLGLLATRWELSPGFLFYTPSRLLVLSITLLVIWRIGYGFWLGWQTWSSTDAAVSSSWIAGSGVAGSLGAGALVLGYYLVYWAGLRRKLARNFLS